MTRRARIVVPGWPHHVAQRGNHRQTVFFSEHDRNVYLDLLRRHFRRHRLSLIGYCLMSNHVHLVVIPSTVNDLSNGVGGLHQDFSRLQHVQHGQTGHLWQNRFFSCPVEGIWEVLAYVELNPVRAHLVVNASDCEWSSGRAHVTGIDKTGLLDMSLRERHFDGASWERFLEAAASRREVQDSIRAATSAGRFWGSEETAERLERELGRPVGRRPRGRPTKKMGTR